MHSCQQFECLSRGEISGVSSSDGVGFSTVCFSQLFIDIDTCAVKLVILFERYQRKLLKNQVLFFLSSQGGYAQW